ncbi:MAG: iron-containing alcohol dehydrogenase [Solirubrobacterales bacterium]|nr:iron-containing alcohol dehydrogenase [Solirubrobacterales bacterium]MBV9715328.1 iron-containing alcohol dehydrogenase [Solirubrobacterales bacterium]
MTQHADLGGSAVAGFAGVRASPRRQVSKFLIPEVIFGVGTLAEVGGAVRRVGGVRPMLVSDPGVLAAGWVERALPYLADVRAECTLWHGLTPNPKDFEVQAAFASYQEHECDALLAIGGGSCIDVAKAVAVLSGNGGSILEYEGIDRATRPIPPMVMVPSTGGSGSDVSQFCVITDSARLLKVTIGGHALVPEISLTDPQLLTTMPPELTAHTGLDALSHAIESCVSATSNFMSRGHALAAIRTIVEHLPAAVEDPLDLGAREAMAQASLQAGIAFTNALLGATHAIAHQIGGALDLPHGLLNAILMPHVMAFNAEADPSRYADVARALGIEVDGRSPAQVAEAAIDRVQALTGALGVPRGLGELGVDPADFGRFAYFALRDAYIATNPRPLTEDDVHRICLAAY